MELRELLDGLFDYRISAPEKLPKRIIYNNIEFIFKDNSYYSVVNDTNIMSFVDHTLDLRCQIEIIEEDKNIEKINYTKHVGIDLSETVCDKINELIDEINKLKKGN